MRLRLKLKSKSKSKREGLIEGGKVRAREASAGWGVGDGDKGQSMIELTKE